MAYFLFIDESGHDRRESPYEVLAGVAIEDRNLWRLIKAIHKVELHIFGTRYTAGNDREIKARKLLKKKTFRHAALYSLFPEDERQALAKKCLENPQSASGRDLAALSQAKLAYVRKVLDTCIYFGCKAFASIVEKNAPYPTSKEHLRKDYAYLFERFFYFLEDMPDSPSGIIVFDELEKSQSHILVGQIDRYFKRTTKGQRRSNLIVPEPFFVHSDLTTGVQIADLIAYIISWGFRTTRLTEPTRDELNPYVDQIANMRYCATRNIGGKPDFKIWSFATIDDLRAR